MKKDNGSGSADFQIKLLANEHCKTGENPLWDAERECVYWTDIPNGKLFRYDIQSARHEQIYSGQPVGGFTLQADGNLLLFRVSDIAELPLPRGGEARTIIEYSDETMERFNDVSADPEGRVFAGTVGKGRENLHGGLYRVDLDGTITRMKICGESDCANGSDFSPDLRWFYWTDSTKKRIFRFDYNRATGDLSNRILIYQASENEGIPDGLTIDADGNLWSARFDGSAIFKHAPDGSVLDKIALPVRAISCACFGGKNLDAMFVTTAEGKSGSESEEGALFQITQASNLFRGKPEFCSRICRQR